MPDTSPLPAEPKDQLDLYRMAVQALGGIAKHARLLSFSDRHGRFLYAGDKPVSASILADTAKALEQHARICRELERRLSPAFTGNMTETQRQQEAGKSAHARGRKRGGTSSSSGAVGHD
ncbi:hypothetical protein [Aurantiacibacter zhengii]|uniref:Uncharacterized protein n=1 Tax=Aurantiacibacter zhengii TaxID=2307003 RepID=A0A418NTZ6_9SPHN|nr:hypothetical protein [Aurantiacibacter zhengii]RIV87469.1 hypothetical protein D2V07_03725 [Aurantiacibacter zhengii]